MLDFLIAQDDLESLSKLLTRARKSTASEVVDLTLLRSTARFAVTGRDSEVDVEAETPGFAQLPLEALPALSKLAKSFPDDPIRIRIEDGRVRVKSAAYSNPKIKLTTGRVRPIDIPDDPSLLDLLAIRQIFNPKQIKESSLTARVNAAEEQRDKKVSDAAESLAELGVSERQVEALVAGQVADHAEKTRKVLLQD